MGNCGVGFAFTLLFSPPWIKPTGPGGGGGGNKKNKTIKSRQRVPQVVRITKAMRMTTLPYMLNDKPSVLTVEDVELPGVVKEVWYTRVAGRSEPGRGWGGDESGLFRVLTVPLRKKDKSSGDGPALSGSWWPSSHPNDDYAPSAQLKIYMTKDNSGAANYHQEESLMVSNHNREDGAPEGSTG